MKTKVYLLTALLITLTFTNVKAQTFNTDAAKWHKKAIMTCGAIKSQNPDSITINKNLSELETEIDLLLKNYLDNPPAEYAKDVNWKTYLLTLSENLKAVKERVESKNYKGASFFCPYFCTTFGKMHKINGTTDLTDLMFAWRMEIKNATDMFNTTNITGAEQNLVEVEKLYLKVTEMKKLEANSSFEELFKPLEESYIQWRTALKDKDKNALNESFNRFFKLFAKPYLFTL